jgi:hypothetical protein
VGNEDEVMKQYGLSAAVAARVLTEVERELRTPPRSVTKRRRLPEPERNNCVPPARKRTMSFAEAIKQMPVHSAVGLAVAWLYFTCSIGHSLFVDLLLMWERLPK